MSGVVVWAYQNDRRQWSPYEPAVSNEIEKAFSTGTQQKIDLGTISLALSCYEVDVLNMQQIRKFKGSIRRLQRVHVGQGSALSLGHVWEFEGDTPSHWVVYDMDTMELLEGTYSQPPLGSNGILDLRHSPLRLPYVINFMQLTQTRTDTGKVRKIRRRSLNQPYSSATAVTNSATGGTTGAAQIPQPSSSSSSSSASSNTLPSSQSASGISAWQSQLGKVKSIGKRQRHQPYASKSGDGQGSQATNQVQGQNPSSQTGFTSLNSQPQYQFLQQMQQLKQSMQQLHTQPYNGQGPLTRRRLQQTTSSQATGPSLSVPSLQQPQQQQMSHAAQPSSMQQQQQQQQYQQSQQQHSVIPHSMQGMNNVMGMNHQSLSSLGPGMHFGFFRSALPPSSLGLPLLPPIAHQQPVFGTSTASSSSSPSSSSSSSTPNSQTPESLPSTTKVTISKTRKAKPKTGMEVLGRYIHPIHKDLDQNDCAICFDKLSEASSYGEGKPDAHDAIELTQCGHQFHKLCLMEMYNANHKDDSVQCPSCKTIYGEKTGICPPGHMQWHIVHGLTLPGYEGCGTICVTYHISPGVQGPEHPNPGQRYSTRGFPRQGFIPDCDQGRKVLKLLMEAFRRRLMFTIGTSHTTGESDTVTWNEIHHKTEPHGNHSGHGYPDPKYLDNVLLELAAHGVTEDSLNSSMH